MNSTSSCLSACTNQLTDEEHIELHVACHASSSARAVPVHACLHPVDNHHACLAPTTLFLTREAGSLCRSRWGACPAPLVVLMLCNPSSTAHPAEALKVLIQHFAVVQLEAAETCGMLCQRQHAAPRHLVAVAEAQHLQPRQLLQVLQQGGLD